MKNKTGILVVVLWFFTCAQIIGAQEKGLASITKNELRKHLLYLASDELMGRATGSEEQKKAADYLADNLEKLGYRHNEKKDPFFQRFNLYKGIFSDKSYITVFRDGKEEVYPVGTDYFFNPYFNVNGKLKGNLVFIGNTSTTMLTMNLIRDKYTIAGISSSLTSRPVVS